MIIFKVLGKKVEQQLLELKKTCCAGKEEIQKFVQDIQQNRVYKMTAPSEPLQKL